VGRQSQYRNDEVIKKLGNKIREARLAKGISQQNLADLCQLELSQINRIELGKINTSISQLFLIAEKLKVPVEKLLPDH
jgi:transcriptional regulator with XRE-family HTH domain